MGADLGSGPVIYPDPVPVPDPEPEPLRVVVVVVVEGLLVAEVLEVGGLMGGRVVFAVALGRWDVGVVTGAGGWVGPGTLDGVVAGASGTLVTPTAVVVEVLSTEPVPSSPRQPPTTSAITMRPAARWAPLGMPLTMFSSHGSSRPNRSL